MWQSAVMDMHRTKLGTTMQGRHRFAGVEQAIWVKRGFHGVKQGQLARTKLHTHLVDFLHTHTVFAGNTATDFNAQLENLAAEIPRYATSSPGLAAS
jgi:hypothetical protein